MKDDKRHSKFHSGDGSISVDDLWKAWQKSEGTCSKYFPEVSDRLFFTNNCRIIPSFKHPHAHGRNY